MATLPLSPSSADKQAVNIYGTIILQTAILRCVTSLRISVLSIELDYLFWAYVFFSCIIISGSTYYYYSLNQQISSGIVFIGFIFISVFFSLRWFSNTGLQLRPPTGNWPPLINYCPDFLTLYTVNNEQVCIDTVGVAETGGISKWSDPTQQDEKYLFHLFTNLTGSTRCKAICQQAKDKKVKWEGIWDGSVCSQTVPPLPGTTP